MIVSDVPVDQHTIDNLPANWQMMQLDQLASIGIGRTPARENSEYWQNGEVPWVSIADLNNGLVTQTKEQVSRKAFEEVFRGKIVTPGTILLSFKLTIGKVGILGVSALHNEAIASLTLTDDNIDRDYLFYTLQNLNYSSYLDTYVKGKTLNKDKIKALAIPSPPISEQKAIAQVLRTVQAAIQVRRDELELEREHKAALMEYLFTHGTRGEITNQTEIGDTPKSWSIVKFAVAVSIANGQVNPTEEPYKSMKHIGPENIEQGSGKLLETKTNEELRISSGNYYFTAEDVLYSKIRPYLNKVALPTFEGTCSADMYPLRPNREYFTREFLYHVMLSERAKNQAIAFQDRTGIPKVN